MAIVIMLLLFHVILYELSEEIAFRMYKANLLGREIKKPLLWKFNVRFSLSKFAVLGKKEW